MTASSPASTFILRCWMLSSRSRHSGWPSGWPPPTRQSLWPCARMSVIFMGRREDDGGSRELVRAFLLERLHLLVLTVVVAGGHGHEQPFHAAVPLPPQDLQPLVELPEVLVHPRPRVDRIQEEIVQACDREAERREPELVRERIPLGERKSPQRLVARDERLEALELVALAVEAEGVHGGGRRRSGRA